MKHSKLSFVRWQAIGLSLLLVVAILVSVLPAGSAFAAAKTSCDKTYEIKRGDTLAKISEKLGWSASQIVYANSLNHPYTIYVGQKICVPDKSASNTPKVNSTEANTAAAYFTAGRNATQVLVYPYNYPNGHNVIVKVDNAGDSVKKYVNLGSFTIGNGKTWKFKLPDSLKNAKLTICLKDQNTSYLQCVVPRSGG